MSGAGGSLPALPRVVLICQSCQESWEPDLFDAADAGGSLSTGCRRCGGWTWLGEVAESTPRTTAMRRPE